MSKKEISILNAAELLKINGGVFTEVFKHGTLSVEYYKPEHVDNQQPHDRDEIYVIASGTGTFHNDGKTWQFQPGDFLFVSAGDAHWFENFTADFATWVFFYGPVGGESNL
jgi:mannose-6-phosphate isomerase-like protein (cupin superfamily)